MNDPPDVVFDCMIFLQAVANTRSLSARVLDLLDTGEIRLYLSKQILREIRNVLNRPEVRAALPGITDLGVEALFQRLNWRAILVRQVPKVFAYPRDPKDEPYIDLAIEVNANYLVSRDSDLLDLMKWNREEGREFQKRFRHLRIVTPDAFMHEVETRRAQP